MAPELPNEDEVYPTQCIQYPPVVQQDEESDDEPIEAGYIPLPEADLNNSTAISYMDDIEDDDNFTDRESGVDVGEEQIMTPMQEMIPFIESVDSEISKEIWNQTRPEDLQIELDTTKTEQIMNVMSNIKLPNIAIPDWAVDIPEECWKEELLQRIRERNNVRECTTSVNASQTNK